MKVSELKVGDRIRMISGFWASEITNTEAIVKSICDDGSITLDPYDERVKKTWHTLNLPSDQNMIKYGRHGPVFKRIPPDYQCYDCKEIFNDELHFLCQKCRLLQ